MRLYPLCFWSFYMSITSSRMGCFILSVLVFFLGCLVSSPFALKSPTDTTVSPTDSVLQTHWYTSRNTLVILIFHFCSQIPVICSWFFADITGVIPNIRPEQEPSVRWFWHIALTDAQFLIHMYCGQNRNYWLIFCMLSSDLAQKY